MIFSDSLGGIVSTTLLGWLAFALIRPEQFQDISSRKAG
jgi:K+-transporting ATPase KdpF subunit